MEGEEELESKEEEILKLASNRRINRLARLEKKLFKRHDEANIQTSIPSYFSK